MNKKVAWGLSALLTGLAPFTAAASTSAELNVAGAIVPAACSVTLPQGGVLDLGDMPLQVSSDGQYFFAGGKQFELAVECSDKQRFGLLFKDMGQSSVPAPADRVQVFKEDTDEVVGVAKIEMWRAVADGAAQYFLTQKPGFIPTVPINDPTNLMVVGSGAEAFKSVTADVRVSVHQPADASAVFKDRVRLQSRIGVDLIYL